MTSQKKQQNNLVDVEKVEKLVVLMKKNKLDIIQAETGTEKIYIARNVGSHNFLQQNSTYTQQNYTTTSPNTQDQISQDAKVVSTTTSTSNTIEVSQIPEGHIVTSPFVGTFYHSPDPDSAPFVEVGSVVKKGQSLCIVEAMKLMNAIEADVDGKIIAVLHKNATPVEFGTPLFVIEPAS